VQEARRELRAALRVFLHACPSRNFSHHEPSEPAPREDCDDHTLDDFARYCEENEHHHRRNRSSSSSSSTGAAGNVTSSSSSTGQGPSIPQYPQYPPGYTEESSSGPGADGVVNTEVSAASALAAPSVLVLLAALALMEA
jgi:hypothetical protein